MGQTARFERFTAELLYVIASGRRIDDNRMERFGEQIEEIYKNPFENTKKKQSADDIKQHVLERLKE